MTERIECWRIAHLKWVRVPDVGILDYGHPQVVPLPEPRKEFIFPPIDKRTHRVAVSVPPND